MEIKMEKIICTIDWAEKNWCASNDTVDGVIAATGKTVDEVKKNFQETLDFDVVNSKENGLDVPEFLASHDYEVEYNYTLAALLKLYQEVTSLEVLSEATGINSKQLSYYLNGKRKPRPAMAQRIRDGFRHIAEQSAALAAL